jgi:uroporphyrinogen III methyltransferase/synthase
VAEALVDALAERKLRRALIVRAEVARDVLPDALRERGVDVEVLPVYRTIAESLDGPALAAAREADYVTFTSASSVRFYVDGAGAPGAGQRIVSIGPITSDALREHGLEPHVEAQEHTPDGLLAALLADVAPGQLF